LNAREVCRVLDNHFTPILERYGIQFMRNEISEIAYIWGGPYLTAIIIPLVVLPRGVVEALVINENDSSDEIEIHTTRIIQLIRTRQTNGELPGYILAQPPVVIPEKKSPKARRIKE